jgi:WXG100 family type VII secretion target
MGLVLLQVDFSALEGLAGAIRRSIVDVERALDDLEGQVRTVSEVWAGAASDGFLRTQADWMTSARDLRSQLVYLHDLVTTTHGNHARAVATNSAIWRV